MIFFLYKNKDGFAAVQLQRSLQQYNLQRSGFAAVQFAAERVLIFFLTYREI